MSFILRFQHVDESGVIISRAVDDYNEIASHFIECMYVHFYSSLPVFV